MDPLSHVICSRTLLELGGQRPLHRGMVAAAMIAGVAPDCDAVLMPVGWDIYLRVHEIGTHSIVGSLVTAGAVAVLVHFVVGKTPWRGVILAAAIGTLSHVALDALSGARLQLLWPLVDARTALPLVAMADPWLVAVFLAGAIALRLARHRTRLVSVVVLILACGFLAFKAMGLTAVRTAWSHGPGVSGVTRPVLVSRWGSLTDWYVFDRTPDLLRKWRVSLRRQNPEPLLSWPVTADSPLIAQSRSLATVRNFLHVHELTFPIEAADASGEARVLWSDLRFCRPADPADAVADTTSINSLGREGIACDVWVGGRFGPDGTPLIQIVRIGGLQQTRAVRSSSE